MTNQPPKSVYVCEQGQARGTGRDDLRERAEKAEAAIEKIRALNNPDKFRCCECCEEEHEPDSELTNNHTVPCDFHQDPWRSRMLEAEARAEKAEAELEQVRSELAVEAKHAALAPGEACDVCSHFEIEDMARRCLKAQDERDRAEAAIERVREVLAEHWDWKAGRSLHGAIRRALDGDQ